MRTVILYSIIGMLTMGFVCGGAKKATQAADPYMTFEPAYYDLGVVKKGEKRELIFKFTNTGKEDIIIEIASGCTCSSITAPEGKAIPPGGQDQIKVVYDSNLEEELGPHNKVVDILLENTDPETGYPIVKEVKYDLILEAN